MFLYIVVIRYGLEFFINFKTGKPMKTSLNSKKFFNLAFFTLCLSFMSITEASVIEDVIVTAEKRSESVQDISQSVTAITEDDLDAKNINSFVDISAIVPGVTVAKNEGYKTVISIRGVGNETNQNAIAAPSVAFHMDGIFIASPFSLQTDFIDVERIEVLRGPQGTLFGQNSTGGAINVISKKPSLDGYANKSDITLGDYGLTKFRSASNIVINENVATRLSFSATKRDGFTENVFTGQDLDDANNLSTPQVADGGMAVGNREVGHLIAPEDVVGLHLLGHLDGVGDRFLNHLRLEVIPEEKTHLLFGLDVFGTGVTQPLLIGDQLAGEHTEQGVVGFNVLLAQVVGIVGRNNLDAEFLGNFDDLNVDDPILRGAVVLDLEVVVVAEDLLVPSRHLASHIGATTQNRLGDLATEAGRRDDQAVAVLLQQLLVDAGTGEDPASTHPPQVTDAGELHQIAIAGGVFRQHHQVVSLLLLGLRVVDGPIDHIHLIADDRLEICALTELQQLNRAVHHAVIGQGDGWHAQLLRPLHHGRQLRRTIQKAVVAVVVERNESHGVSLGPDARSSVQGVHTPHMWRSSGDQRGFRT